jgi:hypothetical protein
VVCSGDKSGDKVKAVIDLHAHEDASVNLEDLKDQIVVRPLLAHLALLLLLRSGSAARFVWWKGRLQQSSATNETLHTTRNLQQHTRCGTQHSARSVEVRLASRQDVGFGLSSAKTAVDTGATINVAFLKRAWKILSLGLLDPFADPLTWFLIALDIVAQIAGAFIIQYKLYPLATGVDDEYPGLAGAAAAVPCGTRCSSEVSRPTTMYDGRLSQERLWVQGHPGFHEKHHNRCDRMEAREDARPSSR